TRLRSSGLSRTESGQSRMTLSRPSAGLALDSWPVVVLLKPTSSLSRHACRPQIASVLVQDHGNDLSARVAFEVEVRVEHLEKGSVFGTREDWEGELPGDLSFELIALERKIDCGNGIEPIVADVIAERGGVEFDFFGLGRKLGHAQFRGRTVAILVQDKSAYRAVGIAREAQTDRLTSAVSGNLGEKLVGRGRENRERNLSGPPGEKPVVHAEYLQQDFIGKLVGSYIVVERRAGQHYHLIVLQRHGRIEYGETQIVGVRGRVGEDPDPPPPIGRETEKAPVAAGLTGVPDDSLIGRHPGQSDANGFAQVAARLLREFHRSGQRRPI